MKTALERQENLDIKQAEVTALRVDEQGRICELETRLGAVYQVKAAILSIRYLFKRDKFMWGKCPTPRGPDATNPALFLSDSLRELGITLRRFKTGTPARVHKSEHRLFPPRGTAWGSPHYAFFL